jgi:hypothetical protein
MKTILQSHSCERVLLTLTVALLVAWGAHLAPG